jgi:DNA repair protein RecO (recombination protein O)
MKLIRTQGVVLRYINRNEADRLLILLSPELGKIMVLARGCRKPKSRFLAASQLFCYADLILQPYRDIYIMNQAEVKNSYFDIRNDLDRLSYATYIVNLTEEAATTGESNFPLFRLLLQGLTFISYGDRDPSELNLIYELKLMDLMGYRPVLDSCIRCGDSPTGRLSFSVEYGGTLCGNCSASDADGIPIDQGTANVMEAILETNIEKSSHILLSPQEKVQMDKILPSYIERKLDKRIKSRDFLKSISQ